MRTSTPATALAGVAIVLLAACGSSGEDPSPEPESPVEAPVEEVEAEAPEEAPDEDPVDVGGDPTLVWSYQHDERVDAIAISPDNTTLAVNERAVYTHQLADGFLLDAYPTRTGPRSLAFSPDGDRLGVGIALYGAHVFDTATGEEVATAGEGYDTFLAYAPDGNLLALGNRDGVVSVVGTAEFDVVDTFDPAGADAVSAITFAAAGELLAVTHFDCTVRVWDVDAAAVVHELELETGDGSCGLSAATFAFSPDGEQMVGAVRIDGTQMLRVWSTNDGAIEGEFEVAERVRDLAFSPDGRLLAVAGNAATQIIDVERQQVRFTIDEVAAAGLIARPTSTAFGHDGGHVAFGWSDGTVDVWRLAGAEELVAPPQPVCEPLPLPGDVLFDTGSAVLLAGADASLIELAQRLVDDTPDATLTFVGHTDSRGDAAANLQLSHDRAASVADWFTDWMQANAVDGWTLETEGRGAAELKVDDVDADGRFLEGAGAINRRVEIEIDAPGCP